LSRGQIVQGTLCPGDIVTKIEGTEVTGTDRSRTSGYLVSYWHYRELSTQLSDPYIFAPLYKYLAWPLREEGEIELKLWAQAVLRIRIRDQVLFYPPDPGSGSGIRDGAMVGSGISKQNL
jgi:hypothetical protein